ncbi:MAG TPA: alpha/beta hydrolase, partial [Burkholderiaceae bacterium]|nr:alpha/beta hydrolase [Burkholderiaceae bacterium]
MRARHLAAFALLLVLGGCYWRIAHEPMPFVAYGDLGPERARGAIVLLPGFASKPEDFDAHGFIEILHRNAPAYDVVAADAHFGYYNKATLLTQLHASVIGPLVARGYRELWIAGVSMGGHGA